MSLSIPVAMRAPSSAEEFLREIGETLKGGGIEEHGAEARLIVEHVLGCDYTRVLAGLAPDPSEEAAKDARLFVEKRLAGNPLAHILGYAHFYNNRFKVAPGVLIPRPETEILVDAAIRLIKQDHRPNTAILDLYTGCGNVLLSIAASIEVAYGLGIDSHRESIACATENCRALNCRNITLRLDDVPSQPAMMSWKYQIVTANPPYVATGDIPKLQPEISKHENPSALDGGPDGLSHYRVLAARGGCVLESYGHLLAEIGAGQAESVAEIFHEWSEVRFIPDLNEIPRVLAARL